VIPLRDANPTQRRPYLTLLLIGLNAAAFLLWEPITGTPQEQGLFFKCHGAIPEEITTFRPLPEVDQACGGKSVVLSIFTSMFLHGGWLHIIGNMLFLWVFGNNIEDRMGRAVFILFYLVSGIVAAYAQAAASSGSEVPLIGASGAVAGVLGAYLVMYPRARVLTLVIFVFITTLELPAVVVLGLWFVLQAFQGLGSLGGDPVGVAWFAHIGGFVFGAVVALAFYRPGRTQRVPAYPRDR
jgi:membrane associated rhomboid family serine protease